MATPRQSAPQPQTFANPSSATSSHAHALQSKHAGIEEQLRAEMARPAPDAAMIQQLKKHKLRLKEEIARL